MRRGHGSSDSRLSLPFFPLPLFPHFTQSPLHFLNLPLTNKQGPEKLRRDVLPALYNGTMTAALAISEPHAGSDVQNIQTTAKLSDDGKHFIVNGGGFVGKGRELGFWCRGG